MVINSSRKYFTWIIVIILILSLCLPSIFGKKYDSNIITHNRFIVEDFLDQYQLLWKASVAVNPPDLLAQSFKPSENILTRVKLLAHKIENPAGNLTVSIRKSLSGSDLTSVSISPEMVPAAKEWIEFDFDNISVQINETYYIIWNPEVIGVGYLWWGYDNQLHDSYPKGEAWCYSSSNWSTEGFMVKDWCFKTYAYHHNYNPLIPVTPVGNTSGLTGIPHIYSSFTSDPNNNQIRYGWDWDGDNQIDEWTDYQETEKTINTTHTWNKPGTYYIKVKAEDTHGAQSNFSSSLKVTMNNNPPNIPNMPEGPSIGINDSIYSYSTTTSDLDNDFIRYGWDWDSDNQIDEWTDYQETEKTINTTHTWNKPGTYYIKVKAEDTHGSQSNFSKSKKVMIISVENDPPEKPSKPIGPNKGKTKISFSYSFCTFDPNGDLIYYMVDWDDGTNTTWIGPFNSGQSLNISHIWNEIGTYQIKVKAMDIYGLESTWSESLPLNIPKNIDINNNYILRFFHNILKYTISFF